MEFETLLIHGGIEGDETTGSVNVPIYQTSTFKYTGINQNKGYDYSRGGNPTRGAVEKLVADLEHGSAGFAFASGMAAITAVLMLFKSGDKILVSENIYGGTYRVLNKVFSNFNILPVSVDTSDEKAVLESITEDVKAIFIETPTNPLMNITDLRRLAEIAKSKDILTIVDNTFMTPYLQKPLTFGIDIVVHSATKYLGGHSDLLAGVVVVNSDELAERVHFIQKSTGGVLSPSDSALLLRGIKTLSVRLDRHTENAIYIADLLKNNEAVKSIYYPGLDDFKDKQLHFSQASGPGALITFELKENYDIEVFFKSLKLATFAVSLGGIETLICHPASMTHDSIPADERKKIGITDNLVRLSVGIEDKKDLIEDLQQAINKAKIS